MSIAFLFVFCATMFTIWIYKTIWYQIYEFGRVPTGFGIFLPLVFFLPLSQDYWSINLIISSIILLILTIIYWIDDIINLSAKIRLALSFSLGASVALVHLLWFDHGIFSLAFGMILVGFISMILVNTINFYDGSDLNLALLSILSFSFFILYLPQSHYLTITAIMGVAFMLAFGIFNAFPKSIFFGDSGSFALVGFFILIITEFLNNSKAVSVEVFIPILLPLIDVSFVLLLRLYLGHNLLTRNYLHLYQKLEITYSGKFYLIPQMVNASICLFLSWTLRIFGVESSITVLLSLVLLSIICYFLCRFLFVVRNIQTESGE